MLDKLVKTEKASLKDVHDILKLENTCFESDRLSLRQLQYFIKSSRSNVMIARENKLLIAYLIILFSKNSTIARLYSLAVDPQFQSRGIAKFLLQLIEHQLSETQFTQMCLEVRKNNYRAINFYKNNNYELFAEYENFYEDGENALRMRKKLDYHSPC